MCERRRDEENKREDAVDESTEYRGHSGGKVTDGLVRIREIWVGFWCKLDQDGTGSDEGAQRKGEGNRIPVREEGN